MEGTLRKALIASAATAALLCAGAASAANLVTNGSFTTNGGNGQLGLTPIPPGTTVAGWSVPSANTFNSYTFVFNAGGGGSSGTTADNGGANGQYGNVQLWGPGNGGGANGLTLSPDGGAFLASDGPFQPGAITQKITGLVTGQQYNLFFDYAAAQQAGFDGPTTSGWNVSIGGTPIDSVSKSILDKGFSGWFGSQVAFTASGPSEVLSFMATGLPSSSVPPFALLDGVSITPVPEPATWALMLVGVGALGAGLRMRRREVFAPA
jgi:hypothetical protein